MILATTIDLANVSDHDQFSFESKLDVEKPGTYTRAMQGPNATQWARAMEEELDQLRKNKTWKLIPVSKIEPSHRALGERWVYRVKRDMNETIARSKARWVVKDYLQQFGVDFDQTFVAVMKPMAFRVLFAIVAFYNLDID